MTLVEQDLHQELKENHSIRVATKVHLQLHVHGQGQQDLTLANPEPKDQTN